MEEGDDIISERNYIFEPSSFAVVAHLERTMLEISLSQTILESKLAQYASRFRAMSAAKDLAQKRALAYGIQPRQTSLERPAPERDY